jgi:hypothetical protein
MIEKMSPTSPSFGYACIQISDLIFRILFIGTDKNIIALRKYAKENNATVDEVGWLELTDIQSEKYFDLYDDVVDINFKDSNDAMIFKLRWC